MSPGGGRLKDEGSRLQVVSAGAVAGLVSRFVIAPLDVVKIRLQLQPHSLSDPLNHLRNAPAHRGTVATVSHILRHEGVTALWKGNVPAELLYVCYASVQFGTYRSMSVLLQDAAPTFLPGGRRLPDAAESFISGASAGAIATTLTYPLDLLRTRFAAQGRRKVYRSLWGAVTDIQRDEGARGFFRGLGPGLAGIVPYMGIFFAAYEQLRLFLVGWNLPWGSGEATAGVIASVAAKTAVFPLDLVRKRIQIQGPARDLYAHGRMPEYRSALHALRSIVLAEGLRGLFKGLPISLIKAAPGSAVTVWTYERALHFAMSLEERGREDVVI